MYLFAFLGVSAVLIGCASHAPAPRSAPPPPFTGQTETGSASWYGQPFHGKKTSSGEIYDMNKPTAAHRTAPFGTNVRVTNLDNGKQVVVTVTDRGPFVRGRIIDVSKKAAEDLGMMGTGTAKVRLEFLDRKPIRIGDIYIQIASFQAQTNATVYILEVKEKLPSISPRIYNENGLYRVRSGPYSKEEDAQNDLAALKRQGFNAFILHTD